MEYAECGDRLGRIHCFEEFHEVPIRKTVHFGQDFLLFRHRQEPRIWHAVAPSTILQVHPSIWSIEVWYSAKHRAACRTHQGQQSRHRSPCALGTLDSFPEAFSNLDHRTRSQGRI